MFLVYPEVLARTIGEGGLEQLASVINFRVFGGIIRREIYIKRDIILSLRMIRSSPRVVQDVEVQFLLEKNKQWRMYVKTDGHNILKSKFSTPVASLGTMKNTIFVYSTKKHKYLKSDFYTIIK